MCVYVSGGSCVYTGSGSGAGNCICACADVGFGAGSGYGTGGKRRRNIKMRAQLRIFVWKTITTEKHKVFKTTLLTFRCGCATYSE